MSFIITMLDGFPKMDPFLEEGQCVSVNDAGIFRTAAGWLAGVQGRQWTRNLAVKLRVHIDVLFFPLPPTQL